MAGRRMLSIGVFGLTLSLSVLSTGSTSHAAATSSTLVTWSCTASPCPWGSATADHSAVWPQSANASTTRHGYTTSAGIYLPADNANGMTVSVETGSATVYAGAPTAPSHHVLAALDAGDSYQVSGLAADEVVSVQSNASFTYSATLGTPPITPPPPTTPPPNEPPPTTTPPPTTPPPTTPPPTTPPPASGVASTLVTWSCTASPCPWGSSTTGQSAVWPATAYPSTTRHGYTTSAAIYLPAVNANTMTVTITTGAATIYAGTPTAPSHRALAALQTGQTYQITGIATDEVISVQADTTFTYTANPGTTTPTTPPPTTPPPTTPPPTTPPPTTPPPGNVINAVIAEWRCNTSNCSDTWVGAVINWTPATAYGTNGRAGYSSRTVTTPQGAPLYPFMGTWADGCQVTAITGTVLIIEWQRGTDTWRETWLQPGQTHTIDLIGAENGALIETSDHSPGFSVTLDNCNPQPLPT
jgi:hypothetical protein